jgi:hypothetical protein
MGNATLTCQDEQWDAPVPTCVPIQCPKIDETFRNGLVICSGYQYGSACQFKCSNNAVIEGPSRVTCNQDGEWSGETFCREISCDVELPYGKLKDTNCAEGMCFLGKK